MNLIRKEDNLALEAAQNADGLVREYLEKQQSFRLEAGAGAGKTFSLVQALKELIRGKGDRLRKNNQKIACITYTNAAAEVISNRIGKTSLVEISTIHVFCWSLMGRFQQDLKKYIAHHPEFKNKVSEAGGVGKRSVEYRTGRRLFEDMVISLHHDDVLSVFSQLLSNSKFQALLLNKYPYLFIDEYQDTNKDVMNAICEHLVVKKERFLLGLFGDHWQHIYRDGCGLVHSEDIKLIPKGANFRSSKKIVDALNNMRPELQQQLYRQEVGAAIVFHTNDWPGERQPAGRGGHWTGDLPDTVAQEYLEAVKEQLSAKGWDLEPGKTKILMLTHRLLAKQQKYESLHMAHDGVVEKIVDERIPFLTYLCEVIEPACAFFSENNYGAMFNCLSPSQPLIQVSSDKVALNGVMRELISLRNTGTVNCVLNFILEQRSFPVPDDIKKDFDSSNNNVSSEDNRHESLTIPYREIIAVNEFINNRTLFSTKHKTKGEEYENVLVIIGRGWSRYNFGQYLEWVKVGVPEDKLSAYKRNRNLFYVCCSRAKKRLALLFTQELQPAALSVLNEWFDYEVVPAPESINVN